jgi:hypothetical protein
VLRRNGNCTLWWAKKLCAQSEAAQKVKKYGEINRQIYAYVERLDGAAFLQWPDP